MLLAEVEIFHSRPIAPTRRLSVGRVWLPGSTNGSAPGFGSLLLGAVCARFVAGLSDDQLGEVVELVHDLEQQRPVAQPRLRHRLQRDQVGLTRSRQRLSSSQRVASGSFDHLVCDFEGSRATPGQIVLGAVYAAGLTGPAVRQEALRAVRRGLAWRGDVGPALFAYLAGSRSPQDSQTVAVDPIGWALEILGFDPDVGPPEQTAVRRGFREALRAAHPDLGAVESEAADRIAKLSEARRILLTR